MTTPGLPDLSPLLDVPVAAWLALAARLREFDFEGARARMVDEDHPPFEQAVRPLRLWHLRRAGDLGSVAIRCLSVNDPIDEADARRLFADSLDPWLGAGLLARVEGGKIVSPYELTTCDGLLLIGDPLERGGDAVMTWGQMTVELMRATWPSPRLGSVLDLGCGAGACALSAAERAERVVGCDINARAIALARLNAQINGIAHADFRAGDLCAPVRGELFDLIVSQPPFVPRHEAAGDAEFLWGGSRGDELPLRALSEAAACLRTKGRALFFVQWPIYDDEPLEARIRRAVPDARLNVLLLEAKAPSLDSACISEVSTLEHPDLGPEYARAVVVCREHYARIGLRELRNGLVVLERREGGTGFTGTVRVGSFNEGRITATHVTALLAAHELAARGKGAILAARVRLPKGTGFVRDGDDDVRAVFPSGSLLADAHLQGDAQAMLSILHESPTVLDAAKRMAKERKMPIDTLTDGLVPAVAAALRAGILLETR